MLYRNIIDLMLLEMMPENFRQEYRAKRLEMFQVILDLHLNDASRESFEQSIELLT